MVESMTGAVRLRLAPRRCLVASEFEEANEECAKVTQTTIDRPGSGAGPRIAYIEAQWHNEIVSQARLAFVAELGLRGIPAASIEIYEVPGSLEIPLQAKMLAESGRYDVIIAAGLVVDGGIYRHEFVASAVIDGIMRVQLETEVPILSVVLTPQRFHEHEEHREFFTNHFLVKGREAANACMRTLANRERLRALVATA